MKIGIKVAIYARVSTSKQESEQTIESQLELLREYVKNESRSNLGISG